MVLNLTEILKIILFGVIEGITEWLPISSTGHMLIADAFINFGGRAEFKEMFFVVIQLGAILAVVFIFYKKMIPFSYNGQKKLSVKKETFSLWEKTVAACIPSAVAGLLFDDYLEKYLHTPGIIAAMLIIYGILFIAAENRNKKRTPQAKDVGAIGFGTAMAIGLFQVLSLVPGTSRSGATIVGALLIGVSRSAATEFTFFLAVPTMIGASVFKLLKFGFNFTFNEMCALLIGTVCAFAVSLAVIKFLMQYIKKHDFKVFGVYRIILGLVIYLFLIMGIIR